MISYRNIVKSLDYYIELGFKEIAVDWTIPEEVHSITFKSSNPYKIDDKFLVGSAEQSFIQKVLDGNLEYGSYIGVTPCFREDTLDELHQRYFMKSELFIYLEDIESRFNNLNFVVHRARVFFEEILKENCDIISTEDESSFISYDIVHKGIELGSYGIRKYGDILWVYGTACAEPRLSYVLERVRNE